MSRASVRRRMVRVSAGGAEGRHDSLAVEEPLEIRVDGRPLTVTMRTPGTSFEYDFDLAVGFLVTEGLVPDAGAVAEISFCGNTDDFNVLDVTLAPGAVLPELSVARNFYTASSCGVCGKASIDAVRVQSSWALDEDRAAAQPSLLLTFPDRLREEQALFESTGGVHAAGLFTHHGVLLALREDVGRHNAVDKVVGWAARADRLPLRETVLVVSGRASFELVQKAAVAGIPMLAAVSAPSTLAVELAEEVGMTLIGFLRGSTMNVYTHPDRVTCSPAGPGR